MSAVTWANSDQDITLQGWLISVLRHNDQKALHHELQHSQSIRDNRFNECEDAVSF